MDNYPRPLTIIPRVGGGGVAILLFTSYYRNRPIKVPAEWGRLLSLWLVWLLFDLFLCF